MKTGAIDTFRPKNDPHDFQKTLKIYELRKLSRISARTIINTLALYCILSIGTSF